MTRQEWIETLRGTTMPDGDSLLSITLVREHRHQLADLLEQTDAEKTYPPKGCPCVVWDDEDCKALAWSCGNGKFVSTDEGNFESGYAYGHFRPVCFFEWEDVLPGTQYMNLRQYEENGKTYYCTTSLKPNKSALYVERRPQ